MTKSSHSATEPTSPTTHSSQPPLVVCQNLTKIFDKATALDDINLEIPRGKIVGLLGQNGAGKTTLIKLLNDLLTPTSGQILIDGQPIGIHSKQIISYLPERTYLNRYLHIQDALQYFSEFYDNFSTAKAEELLKTLDLTPDMQISKMSKGMIEKLQLILVMSRNAELYILDEPLGGVDPATRDYILDTILNNFHPGSSALISTHLITDVERILDEIIFIDHGKITLTGEADVLRHEHQASIDEIFRQTFKTHAL